MESIYINNVRHNIISKGKYSAAKWLTIEAIRTDYSALNSGAYPIESYRVPDWIFRANFNFWTNGNNFSNRSN